MKKFMKGCAIAAVIMLALGFVITTVTVGIHGTISIGDLVNAATHGRIQEDDEHWKAWENRLANRFANRFAGGFVYHWLNFVTGGFENGMESLAYDFGDGYHIYDNFIFDDLYETYSGDISKLEVGSSSVKNLDLELGGCTFDIVQSPDTRFYVDCTGNGKGKMQAYQSEDGTLHLKMVRSNNYWKDIYNSQVTLYVPANYKFTRVEANLGGGTMYLGTLQADQVELILGAGEAMVDNIIANTLELSAGAGNINIDDMTVNTVKGTVDAGSVYLYGRARDFVGMECNAGYAYMELDAREKDYNYQLYSNMGNISINGRDNWPFGDTIISHSSDKNINIQCSVGSVDLVFNR